ncbi:MAG: response regulator, partial [Mariprofundus sp.]
MADLLLVEDDANARRILSLGLEMQGHQVSACASPDEAERCLNSTTFDVVLTDLRMDGRDAGLDVIRCCRAVQPHARVMLLTAYASADTAVAAMKQGAFDYLTKPVSSEELAAAVERALFDISRETGPDVGGGVAKAEHEIKHEGILIGGSEVMQRARQRLQRAAKSQFTVLVSGESG